MPLGHFACESPGHSRFIGKFRPTRDRSIDLLRHRLNHALAQPHLLGHRQAMAEVRPSTLAHHTRAVLTARAIAGAQVKGRVPNLSAHSPTSSYVLLLVY